MSTVAETKSPVRTAPATALLFELEGVALPVRPLLFEAARAHLAAQQVTLSPAVFARCGGPIATLATQIFDALRIDRDHGQLAQALHHALLDHLSAERIKLHPGFARLLNAAVHRGITAAALSGLPEDAARAAFNASGLESLSIQLFIFSDEEKPFPRADAWLKAAKQLGKTARCCVAVSGSHAACKTSLSAGMCAIAAPDEFTAHHDFSGADVILETWDDVDVEKILDAVTPAPR